MKWFSPLTHTANPTKIFWTRLIIELMSSVSYYRAMRSCSAKWSPYFTSIAFTNLPICSSLLVLCCRLLSCLRGGRRESLRNVVQSLFVKGLQCSLSFPLAWPAVTVVWWSVVDMPSFIHNKRPTWSIHARMQALRFMYFSVPLCANVSVNLESRFLVFPHQRDRQSIY